MRVGIAIDPWKLTIFHRRLTAAGYAYEKRPGVMGTLLLTVEVPAHEALLEVTKEANREAAKCRDGKAMPDA